MNFLLNNLRLVFVLLLVSYGLFVEATTLEGDELYDGDVSKSVLTCEEELSIGYGKATLNVNDFVTTWKTDNSGPSSNTEIRIPTTGGGYNYDVDWDNDGTFDEFGIVGDVTHDFGSAGTYTIRIQGAFPRIYFSGATDKEKILSVDQWGNQVWDSMSSAFSGCINLVISAADVPDLSSVFSMSDMFRNATGFNSAIGSWDVSHVTNFNSMFLNTNFDQDLSSWDMGNAITLASMFSVCPFNQDISVWNTASVTNMSNMFNTSNFNQDIGGWNTGSVTDMHQMFKNDLTFSQDIGSWDMEDVTDVTALFFGATLSVNHYDALLIGWDAQALQSNLSFNGGNSRFCNGETAKANIIAGDSWTIADDGKECATSYFITTWDTTKAGATNNQSIRFWVNGSGLLFDVDWDNDGVFDETYNSSGSVTHDFGASGVYTINIRGVLPHIETRYWLPPSDALKLTAIEQWGDIGVESFKESFGGCANLVINAIDSPDLSNVTDMSRMFNQCTSMNHDMGNWNTSTITEMSALFAGCTAFNQDVGSWNTSAVDKMSGLFSGATIFNQDIGGWNTSSVTNMSSMFANATAFDQDIGSWNTGNVKFTSNMFENATSFNQDIGSWNMANVEVPQWMFKGATSFNQDISGWITNKFMWTTYMFDGASSFNQDIGNWNMGLVENMYRMFADASSFNHDIGDWNTGKVKSMNEMFKNATDFNQDLDWNTSAVTDMRNMFYNATSFNGDIHAWDTSSVTTMAMMFYRASDYNQPMSGWNLNAVTLGGLSAMFASATSFNQDISSWVFPNATSLSSMFSSATSFNQDISAWNVASITYMTYMFDHATSFNQDIGGWNTSSLVACAGMFNGATAFDQDISGWDVADVTMANWMFDGVTLSTANYDALLIGWDAQTLNSNVTFSGGNSMYCAGETARNNMMSSDNWSITDGNLDPGCSTLSLTDFVTTWKTNNAGSSNNTSISIPTTGAGYNYDVDIDNDGTFEIIGANASLNIDFGAVGTYTIRIQGSFPRIYFNNSGDKDKILSIDQWGNQQWTSMEKAFSGCSNLVENASDFPDLALATSVKSMFDGATNLNQDISNWSVGTIQYFNQMFKGASAFNKSIANWDTSSALEMTGMFRDASAFNQSLNLWDVSHVTDMSQLFSDASSFSQDLNSWNTSSVTNMYSLFFNASAFNGNISGWNTSAVTNMHSIFSQATSFNQDIGSWDVSHVTDFAGAFTSATVFNADISGWVTSAATTTAMMFTDAVAFNQNIGGWDTANVGTMMSMFENALSFNQNIGAWDVTALTNAMDMFNGVTLSTYNYDALLNGWDAQVLNANVPFSAGNSQYCMAKTAHANMLASDSWIITDDGYGCDDCSAPSTNWNGAWSNGVPNALTPVVINANFDTGVDGSFSSCNCTINAGNTITLRSGDYINTNDLVNNGSLIIDDSGAYVQESETATVSGGGYFRMDRKTTPYVEYDYTYWSSPSTGETIGNVFTTHSALIAGAGDPNAADDDPFSDANHIYWLDTANFNDDAPVDTFDDEYNDWVLAPAATAMTPGKGFIALGAGSDIPFSSSFATGLQQQVYFEGTFNAGDIPYTLVADNSAGDSFTNQNLIGNPYPSAIDINKFMQENTSMLEGTFYFWTHDSPVSGANPGPDAFNFTNNDYAVATSNGSVFSAVSNGSSNTTPPQFIASGQGFLVNVSNAGLIHFKNSMRVLGSNNDFKGLNGISDEFNIDRVWLNLTNDLGMFRQVLVGFYEGATAGFDQGLDGQRLENGVDNDFFSIIENDTRRFAIQHRTSFNTEQVVPLGIEIKEAGSFQISLDHFEGIFEEGQAIFLRDKTLGVTHNLTQSDYLFSSEVNNGNIDRFELCFTNNTTALQDVSSTLIHVFPNPSNGVFKITWHLPNKPKSFNILDVTGNLISSNKLSKRQTSQTLDLSQYSKGVYFVTFFFENTMITQKLIVQ